MKNSFKYIFFILVLLGIIFIIEGSLPRKFSWYPTFRGNDKQPFGCYVFDDILATSLPTGYSVTKKTFSQMERDSLSGLHALLTVNTYLDLSNNDLCSLIRLAEKGNKVFLIASYLPQNLLDTLGVQEVTHPFSLNKLKRYGEQTSGRDTLFLQDSIYKKKSHSFYKPFIENYFYRYDNRSDGMELSEDSLVNATADKEIILTLADTIDCITLAKNTEGFPVALTFPVGKGEIRLVSTPLIFTNYGMLDNDNAAYIFKILAEGVDFPFIRTEAYGKNQAEQESPLRFMLSHKPLRWSLYFCLTCILLFMILTAKRKQRAIPIIHEPVNKSLEFIQLIGTLYYQKKDYTDLVRKKYIYFTAYLKRTAGVHIELESPDNEIYRILADKLGVDTCSLKKLLTELNQIQAGKRELTETEMRKYIDRMNEFMNNLP